MQKQRKKKVVLDWLDIYPVVLINMQNNFINYKFAHIIVKSIEKNSLYQFIYLNLALN